MPADSGPEYDVVFAEDESETTVTVAADETFLEAARRADIALRWSCTEGKCTSCTGRLVAGDIEWVSEPKAVQSDQRDEGYISLCLTRPESPGRIEVGDGVLVEAFPSVWRNLDTDGD